MGRDGQLLHGWPDVTQPGNLEGMFCNTSTSQAEAQGRGVCSNTSPPHALAPSPALPSLPPHAPRQANAAMVAAARRNKATGPDKKHAMWVAFNVAVSGTRGRADTWHAGAVAMVQLPWCSCQWHAAAGVCAAGGCHSANRAAGYHQYTCVSQARLASSRHHKPISAAHLTAHACLATCPPPRQPHEALKGRSWLMESDLRSGAAVRLDKTGKTLLTLLRHLGR